MKKMLYTVLALLIVSVFWLIWSKRGGQNANEPFTFHDKRTGLKSFHDPGQEPEVGPNSTYVSLTNTEKLLELISVRQLEIVRSYVEIYWHKHSGRYNAELSVKNIVDENEILELYLETTGPSTYKVLVLYLKLPEVGDETIKVGLSK
jgi:hypothetical protein